MNQSSETKTRYYPFWIGGYGDKQLRVEEIDGKFYISGDMDLDAACTMANEMADKTKGKIRKKWLLVRDGLVKILGACR